MNNLNTNIKSDFLDNFTLIENYDSGKNKLKFYCPIIDANEFSYEGLVRSLRSAASHYCLSRRTYEEYKDNPMELSYEVREKFRKFESNTGELGELMMFSFLESDLNAPKILTKMELKTNPNNYFNGADGVHYLKLSDGNYQLIFGESKAHDDLLKGFKAAIDSISKFKNNKIKDDDTGQLRGITFEKSLLNAHLSEETFNNEEREFIKSIIYPKSGNKFNVDTAFGVFILYNSEFDPTKKDLSNSDYRTYIYDELKNAISEAIPKICSHINSKKMNGHCFYIYIVPFEELSKNRKDILKEAIS